MTPDPTDLQSPPGTPRAGRSRRVHPLALGLFVVGFSALGLVVLGQRMGVLPAGPAQPQAALQGVSREVLDAFALPDQRPQGPRRIVVTLPPLAWAVRQLAPADAIVTVTTAQGVGCHGVELTPAQVAAVRKADLVVMVGLGLEPSIDSAPAPRWQQRVSMGGLLSEDESAAAALNTSDHDHAHHDHDHDPDHAHHHPEVDPHLWLDPVFMKRLIERLASVMATWEPAAPGSESPAADLAARAARAIAAIDEVDAAYRLRLAGATSRALVTQHEAWSHLARRYGLEIAAVLQPLHDVEPSPGDVSRAAAIIRERGLKAIFTEPQLSPAAAQRVAQSTGAALLSIDPVGGEDWPATMLKNLDVLSQGLGAPAQ